MGPDLTGTYSLVSFNNLTLPAVVSVTAGTDTIELRGWVLRVDGEGNFTSRSTFRRTQGGLSSTDTVDEAGRYLLRSEMLVLRFDSGEVRTLRVDENGEKLTTVPGPDDRIIGIARLDVLVYRKGELGTVP
jgi:hypothetical protein